MQLYGAFQSHVLRLCALQILLEALVCKSNECLGNICFLLNDIKQYALITLVTGSCGATGKAYQIWCSNQWQALERLESWRTYLWDPHFKICSVHQDLAINGQWHLQSHGLELWLGWCDLQSRSFCIYLHDDFADPVSWSGSLKFDMLKLMANVRICTITRFRPKPQNFMKLLIPSSTRMGDTSPQIRCLANAALPEARLSWVKRVSHLGSTKRWHLPSHAEHELRKVCICTFHLELVGLKKRLPTIFKNDIWYTLKESYLPKILALSM